MRIITSCGILSMMVLVVKSKLRAIMFSECWCYYHDVSDRRYVIHELLV